MTKAIFSVALVNALVLLGGCAGGFRSEAKFEQYVGNLHLTEMSVETAAVRLRQDGFICETNTHPQAHPIPSVYCRKSWHSGPIYQIWLQPTKTDPNKSIVEPSTVYVTA